MYTFILVHLRCGAVFSFPFSWLRYFWKINHNADHKRVWTLDTAWSGAYDTTMKKLHDHYFKQAKREGKLARSVYKLEELNRRETIIKKGDAVLDLGSSPGSWLEYIIAVVGPAGKACAVDLKPIHKKFKSRAHFKMMDIRDMRGDEFADIVECFDAVVSDMAPNTSGIRIVDQAKSQELCEHVFALCRKLLKPGGNMVCKIFYGPETERFKDFLGEYFKTAKIRKPSASRGESTETYIICLGFGEKSQIKPRS